MAKTFYTFKNILLITGDIGILYLSLYGALFVRYGAGFTDTIWQAHVFPFSLSFALWVIIFHIGGLYNPKITKNDYRFYATAAKTILFAIAATMIVFYLMPAFGIAPKTNLLLVGIIFFALFALWRNAYNALIRSRHLSNTIIFVGMNKETKDIIAMLDAHPQLGYAVAGVVEHDGADRLSKIIKEKNVDTIVYTKEQGHDGAGSNARISKILYTLIPLGADIVDLPKFYAQVTRKIPVSIIGETWFLENLITSEKNLYKIEKRALDLVSALVLGAITLPFMPLVALLIVMDSRGPVFYRQKRVGKNGRQFALVKFRTMIDNAERQGVQWTQTKDRRVTKIGSILRKTRIDELPQLWNILKGDMSFIGPRPERPEFVATLEKEIPHYPMRHLIKPGLTGWAQINQPLGGASVSDSMEKLQYDLYYIKNRNLIIDFDILMKTIRVVVSREGY
ncbi:hypothetical protein A3C91_03635 [Candidatus Azambacteria bacterium RIFCSPHIGHO2_02_FULL_52_12]|uniref:Bacterial sugar transferase domain-containing protein n=1 Tax=Candidatus Azambacteria bacterium RIFCSPLOWO2_01_FULL_46_25 TaxID=1797298 RepID=A0A1F5BW06_9BACT|nr:MAG: hypothetical protein A3C91_03635 [Candidatus Azambacteria bacterium RIFCSPHIGHO2_02_FULL_52_12]OGD34794.1 MAG: hypothetical protein A2988_04865 [Candidatus Azambacteria bacterium RIFCSPLOWO2_01_FULL_46_25]OGD37923.1 MAG: hypothetical protein A2850_04100 [Candidatus Azambacteria bacterium RIFCSPHIGHO2_01_FULL_51_74]